MVEANDADGESESMRGMTDREQGSSTINQDNRADEVVQELDAQRGVSVERCRRKRFETEVEVIKVYAERESENSTLDGSKTCAPRKEKIAELQPKEAYETFVGLSAYFEYGLGGEL